MKTKCLIGEKFQSFTVMRRVKDHNHKTGHAYWECQCECGNKILISGRSLKTRENIRCYLCPSIPKLDLISMTFGKLAVISYIGPAIYGNSHKWDCVCECGQKTVLIDYQIHKRRNIMCGDCMYKRNGEAKKKYVAGEISSQHWKHIISGANSRNLEFSITPEYAYNLFIAQDTKCVYSDMPITLVGLGKTKHNPRTGRTASLDRIDNNLGYVVGNIQWVHKTVNSIKSNLPEEQFLKLCVLVGKFHSGDVSA